MVSTTHPQPRQTPPQGFIKEAGIKIAEGQHTPYQIAVGKTDYKVRRRCLTVSVSPHP